MIPYNTRPCQVFWKMFFRAWPRACARARGEGSARRQQCGRGGLAAERVRRVAAGVLTWGGGREGRGARACGLGLGRVLCWGAGVPCEVSCGRCACARVVFLGAVGDAWCSLRGDGVASVVVVVWCRVVYPPNKTCNAKTSYKYAILVLACKSLCGA